MASSLRVNAIVPASGTNVAIGTAGGTITYTASVSGVSTFSNGIIVSAGSTSAPSISPVGDSNTGIFFPSADTIAIGEGGSEAIRIDSSGRVGVGTDNLAEKFNVEGKSIFASKSFSNNLVISPNNHSAGTDIECFNNGNTVKKSIALNPYGGNVGVGVTNPTNIFQVTPSGLSAALIVDSSGRVITQYRPAFFAYPNTGSSLGGVQTYVFSLTQFNIGSHYSTATGRFTAPVAGVYHFDYGVQHNASVNDNLAVDLNVNNSQYSSVVRTEVFTSSTFHIVTASATIYLNASDFVTIASISGTAWGDNSWFSGHFVG